MPLFYRILPIQPAKLLLLVYWIMFYLFGLKKGLVILNIFFQIPAIVFFEGLDFGDMNLICTKKWKISFRSIKMASIFCSLSNIYDMCTVHIVQLYYQTKKIYIFVSKSIFTCSYIIRQKRYLSFVNKTIFTLHYF